jgi:hypothetical protein
VYPRLGLAGPNKYAIPLCHPACATLPAEPSQPSTSWHLIPMGNDQSSQKIKQRQQHDAAASKPPKRRASSAAAALSSAFRVPSQSPYSPPPPPYSTAIASVSPLPPIPDGKQVVETNPFRMPSPQSPRRTKSHGAHVVPRLSQLLAGTGQVACLQSPQRWKKSPNANANATAVPRTKSPNSIPRSYR